MSSGFFVYEVPSYELTQKIEHIRFIQQMREHVSIGTTEIYTHVFIVKLKQIHGMTSSNS